MPEAELTITRDPEAFAARASAFLEERAERNILATTLIGARARHHAHTGPLFAIAGRPGREEPAAVAIRTPPAPLAVAGLEQLSSQEVHALLQAWIEHDPQPPGVNGEPGSARPAAAALQAITGRATRLAFQEAMHALTEVRDPPRPASGDLREIQVGDREILIEWEAAFVAEAGLGDRGIEEHTRRVDRRLAEGLQFVWCDHDRPVCAVGFNPAVAGTTRIGPVYTLPQHRNRGYATSAVAEASRRLLQRPTTERCMLLTDLANPTSNRIYASIGYVRFAEWEEHVLAPPADVGDGRAVR